MAAHTEVTVKALDVIGKVLLAMFVVLVMALVAVVVMTVIVMVMVERMKLVITTTIY